MSRHLGIVLGSFGLVACQPPPDIAAAIEFRAVAGQEPARCGASYSGLGLSHATVRLRDFRLYVSDVRLLDAAGREVPLALTPDGLWQTDRVALLDFEDASDECSGGTPETRHVVEGSVPAGRYRGLRFTLGVPFELNHRDPATQPSPLDLSRMFWTWNSGYKFARIDLATGGPERAWSIHLGSTACLPAGSFVEAPTSCAHPNRVTVSLQGFDPWQDAVELDLATLLAESDVRVNQPDTGSGCESAPGDQDCVGIFHQLGLPFGRQPAGVQRVFRAAPRRAS